jgi:hypothetical protein
MISAGAVYADSQGISSDSRDMYDGSGAAYSESLATARDHLDKPIRPQFFGMHVNNYANYKDWPMVPFGAFRLWDVNTQWRQIATSSHEDQWDWEKLDTMLNVLKQNNIGHVTYTFGGVPQWAGGGLYGFTLPSDIDKNGNGTDHAWKSFVTAIAKRANDPVYLQTHARIGSWEVWNEWSKNPWVNPTWQQGDEIGIYATYAQMVRMTEDLRCVITGKGSVNGVPCTNQPIDARALILTPSEATPANGIMENFLHCDDSPMQGSECTTGDRGSQAVDIINTHLYIRNGTMPEELLEEVGDFTKLLQKLGHQDDLDKPFWNNEGSWGVDEDKMMDKQQEAAFVARYYLMGHSVNLRRMYWYSYDICAGDSHKGFGVGTLYCPTDGTGELWPSGVAYGQVFDWMVGSTMTQPCSAGRDKKIYTCGMRTINGRNTLAVWDTSQRCWKGHCSTSEFKIPPGYNAYETLEGFTIPLINQAHVPIGARPILLIGGSGITPKGDFP